VSAEGEGPSAEGAQGRNFFGRLKGKRLRPGQEARVAEVLPRLRVPPEPVADLAGLFPGRPARVRLEIGFGGGEHLAALARREPEAGVIGCEPFVNGVAKLLGLLDAEGLDNVRLWDRDAAELLALLPEGGLDEIFLLYPDPWPKRRQRKRRFVSDASLSALARVLRPGGHFRFATDIDDYAGWTLARALRSPDFAWTAEAARDWSEPWPGWIRTRYEAKAVAAGRRPSYLTFRRL
jgi:tRNA (guanine-N7-)-methyltransferase